MKVSYASSVDGAEADADVDAAGRERSERGSSKRDLDSSSLLGGAVGPRFIFNDVGTNAVTSCRALRKDERRGDGSIFGLLLPNLRFRFEGHTGSRGNDWWRSDGRWRRTRDDTRRRTEDVRRVERCTDVRRHANAGIGREERRRRWRRRQTHSASSGRKWGRGWRWRHEERRRLARRRCSCSDRCAEFRLVFLLEFIRIGIAPSADDVGRRIRETNSPSFRWQRDFRCFHFVIIADVFVITELWRSTGWRTGRFA